MPQRSTVVEDTVEDLTMSTPMPYQLFVGIDVAAVTFTVAWTPQFPVQLKPITLPQTPTGYATLVERLTSTGTPAANTLVALEATGTYWVALAVSLHSAGFVVSVLHPVHVANYGKSLARRAKTDPRDAELLVQFAIERQPSAWTPPPDVYHELRQRLVARDALITMRQQARNHRHALVQWPVQVASVKAQLDAVIADFDARIRTLEHEIAEVLAQGAWAESATLLLTINSIGPLTTAWLLVATLNFELCTSAEAAVAYAGLAPVLRESGTSVRGRSRIGHTGNKHLRTALYLATLNAARFNPAIKPFYERLRAAGKPAKVARCAAARKLLQIAWAVAVKRRPFVADVRELTISS